MDWRSAAGDLLLGAACPGCGSPGWGLCAACRELLAGREPRVVRPSPEPAGFPFTVTSSSYDELMRRLINAYKERQAYVLTGVLARRLAANLSDLLIRLGYLGPAVVVPIPSARRTVRERGFDATATLARRAVRISGVLDLRAMRVLAQARGVRDQAGLDAASRRANLAGGIVLRRDPGRPVVLLDDLVTTGSSLTEAARVLRRHGIDVLGAVTLAATVRRARGASGP